MSQRIIRKVKFDFDRFINVKIDIRRPFDENLFHSLKKISIDNDKIMDLDIL